LHHLVGAYGNSSEIKLVNPEIQLIDHGCHRRQHAGSAGLRLRRRGAEGDLRAQESLDPLRTLVEQIPAVTYIQSLHGAKPMEYVSPHIEDMLGYSPNTEAIDDEFLIEAMGPALSAGSAQDASGYFRHCGYEPTPAQLL